MRKSLALAFGFLLLAAGFFTLRERLPSSGTDPDRYFHIALSRDTVASGSLFLRTLPQVEGLGWHEYFSDKEFLFHQVTNLAYRLAGERGVIEASLLCAIAALLVFLLEAGSALPPLAAIAITIATFAQPYLALRLVLVRPHTLAVLTFILLTVAILRRKPFAAAAAGLLFALSYHAFYLPLLCLGWLFVLSFLDTKESAHAWRKTALGGACGTIAGILINPYFPANIVMAVIHSRIPGLLKNEFKNVAFGKELYPARADEFLLLFGGIMLVLAVALVILGRELREPSAEARVRRIKLLYLCGTSAFFLALTFQILRAAEYLVPAVGLILVQLFDKARPRKLLLYGTTGTLAALQLGFLFYAYKTQTIRFLLQNDTRMPATFAAVDAIPKDARGKKVFNCDWDRTPYLMYARPDLRFIDILDPSFLYFTNPGAFWVREQLRRGEVGDAHGLIRDAFRSDFVLCADPPIIAQLREDPGFQQLYPAPGYAPGPGPAVVLFRVKKEPIPQFVLGFDLHGPMAYSLGELEALEPAKSGFREVALSPSTFLNLAAEWKATELPAGKEALCAVLSPRPSEMKRLEGASFIAIGGGHAFRLWRNGKPVFHSRGGFPALRSVQMVLPLSTPLRAGDKLELLVCSKIGAPNFGASLSLWSAKALAELCEGKGAAKPDHSRAWEFSDSRQRTCIGPLAVHER